MMVKYALRRYAPWIVAAIAIAAYYPRFIKDPGGTLYYIEAANCMLRGETPLLCKTTLFTYPPFFALLMTPLTWMADWLRDAIWYVILIGTLIVSLGLSKSIVFRIYPGDWTKRELIAFRCVAMLLSAKFLLAVLENQAYDSIALVFLLLGLLAMVDGRSLAAAAGFAVAAALKVTPLIFLPYLLLKRRFAAVAVFLAIYFILSLLPDLLLPPNKSGHFITWLREVALAPFFGSSKPVYHPFWVGENPLNQSLRGLLSRLISEFGQAPQFKLLLYAIIGAYAACVSVLLLKSRRDDRLVPVDGALLMISMLLLSPVSSRSHFVLLMLPYMIIVADVLRDRTTKTLGSAILVLSFLLATGSSNDVVGESVSRWSHWYGLMTWGALVLVPYFGVVIWSATRSSAEPRAVRLGTG